MIVLYEEEKRTIVDRRTTWVVMYFFTKATVGSSGSVSGLLIGEMGLGLLNPSIKNCGA